jgi:hypothetical protein
MIAGSDADPLMRLREIEDRKIEILMEIAEINGKCDARMARLNEEYAELDAEHYLLRLQGIRGGRPSMSHEGDGEP